MTPMTDRGARRRVWWVNAAGAAQLALVAWLAVFLLVVLPRTRFSPADPAPTEPGSLLALVVAVSTLTGAGHVLGRRQPAHRLVGILFATPLLLALQYALHSWQLLAERYGWPGVDLTRWATTWIWVFLPTCLTLLLLRLPSGAPLGPRWLRYERLAVGHVAIVAVLFALAPRLPSAAADYPPNPWGVPAFAALAQLSLAL
jgi:hypothetical protein